MTPCLTGGSGLPYNVGRIIGQAEGEMEIKAVLAKIEETPAPKVGKAAIAYSGGLDSSLGVELLRRKYGAQ